MNWKAYDEVHFSDQYILRWVREGDEYVNRISKEMMEDLHAVVRQQQAEYYSLLVNHDKLYAKVVEQQAEIEALKSKTLTDEEIIEIWSGMETDTGEQNIAFARAILKKAQNK